MPKNTLPEALFSLKTPPHEAGLREAKHFDSLTLLIKFYVSVLKDFFFFISVEASYKAITFIFKRFQKERMGVICFIFVIWR